MNQTLALLIVLLTICCVDLNFLKAQEKWYLCLILFCAFYYEQSWMCFYMLMTINLTLWTESSLFCVSGDWLFPQNYWFGAEFLSFFFFFLKISLYIRWNRLLSTFLCYTGWKYFFLSVCFDFAYGFFSVWKRLCFNCLN